MATLLLNKLQNIEPQNRVNTINTLVFGDKISLVAKLFGCWHENMSRPFGEGKIVYRSCLKCGARKQFDTETLQTFGKFYYPPLVKKIEIL